MDHRKKTGITIVLSIFVCLIGLLGSFAGSLRYGLRDKAIETLAKEWELSQMQITKIADRMSMAQFFVVMVQTPGIGERGATKLLDAEYTRDFIAVKMRDYRDDLLKKTGKGRIDFEDFVDLEETNRDAVCQDLQYSLTAEDMENYELLWDNLGLADRIALGIYRDRMPGIFGFASMVLSGWFLALAVLLIVGEGVGLWFLNGRNFRGHGIYGIALLILGITDCAAAAFCVWLPDVVNHIVDMRSNLMEVFFSPVGNMLLVLGMVFTLLGAVVIVLSDFAKKSIKRRMRKESIAGEP